MWEPQPSGTLRACPGIAVPLLSLYSSNCTILTLPDKCYVSLPLHMGADSEAINAISISKEAKPT